MQVLSLFDGISCGRVALQRAGFNVKRYYASEIDKYAIQVSQNNYPDIIRLGDIENWRSWDIDWTEIDLILAGSPCQSFSMAGKRLAFHDPRGQLLLVFVDILKHIQRLNPDVKFLLENVRMKKEYQQVISHLLGVEPIIINSALFSAQDRKRLYWCNWKITQPEDRGILLKDILLNVVSGNYLDSPAGQKWFKKKRFIFDKQYVQICNDKNKTITLTGRMFANWNDNLLEVSHLYLNPRQTEKIVIEELSKGKIGFIGTDHQGSRIYTIHGKSVTLMAGSSTKQGHDLIDLNSKPITIGNTNPSGRGMNGRICSILGKSYTLTCNKGEGIKTGIHQLTDCIEIDKQSYVFACHSPDRLKKKQNGQRFNEGNKSYTLTTVDTHGILKGGYIRKLHPIECERLQTLDDGFSEGISNTQRYKVLGNGWTVDVIVHLLMCMAHKK